MQTWLWLFCSSREQEFEKVFEFKTRQVYFIYPFLRRLKLAKPFKTSCANFFKLICQATKIRILESIFLQNKIDFVYFDFASGTSSSFMGFAITKSFAFCLGNAIL